MIVIDPTASPKLNVDTVSGFVSEFKQLKSSPYEPWGVIEPISWLTQQAGVQL